jgi:hypothetical protein
MLNIVEYETDWSGEDAIVLHVYEDAQQGGVCGFTTFALTRRPPDAEVLHMPFGTPVQFAFTSAMEICKRLGIQHLVINDPGKLFAPDVRHMGPMALSPSVQPESSDDAGPFFGSGAGTDLAFDRAY